MRLHLASISDIGLQYRDAKYVEPTGIVSINNIAEKKTHKNMMIDIASALSYKIFEEIKDCKSDNAV